MLWKVTETLNEGGKPNFSSEDRRKLRQTFGSVKERFHEGTWGKHVHKLLTAILDDAKQSPGEMHDFCVIINDIARILTGDYHVKVDGCVTVQS